MDYLKYNLKEGYKKIYNFYELNNHLMTLGLDILWRKKAVNIIKRVLSESFVKGRRFIYCDFCIGTGEFFDEMVKIIDYENQNLYIGVDFSFDMLNEAKNKKSYKKDNSMFILADVGWLPFKDNSVDLVTISWGIRNLRNPNDIKDENIFHKRFREVFRVIRKDGYFCGLETSRPPNRVIRKVSDIFVLYFSTNIAKMISGDFKTYTYLAKSIVDFMDAEKFKDFLLNVGFKNVNYYLFTFGIAALHCAKK
ncbi:MAG: ubiquinone/menaquinone biosynthesis methyltransferase [bacterium]